MHIFNNYLSKRNAENHTIKSTRKAEFVLTSVSLKNVAKYLSVSLDAISLVAISLSTKRHEQIKC